jgi:hypothetical protein
VTRNLPLIRRGAPFMGALTLLLALFPAVPPAAQGIDPTPFYEARFGIVSLARLQNARLNVLNLAFPPDPTVPPNPCKVSISFVKHEAVSGVDPQPFHNAAGAPIMVEVLLHPGQSAAVELTSANAFRGTRDLRIPFRATGMLSPPPDDGTPPPDDGRTPPDPCRSVVPSLEIYEALTGRTQVFTSPLEIFGFNPQPEPPIPSAGG